jgi:hypothetical protein
MKRVVYDCIFFLSVFLFPWWFTLVVACVGLFIFPKFFEFVCASIIMYTLFVSSYEYTLWFARPFWFALIVVGLYIGVQALRRAVIFYKTS